MELTIEEIIAYLVNKNRKPGNIGAKCNYPWVADRVITLLYNKKTRCTFGNTFLD